MVVCAAVLTVQSTHKKTGLPRIYDKQKRKNQYIKILLYIARCLNFLATEFSYLKLTLLPVHNRLNQVAA